ncbi:MAG: biotin--[acetyl-CoA-carboxylase] ligase [Saprospiraceae bacterium]|nr:biotin--[acetyl-CoA-carboxylase] ligase [Saprospiraceae bacterium]
MANTLFAGKVYHRFDELPSTNDYARDLLAKSKPPEGTVVRAASQSAGRGQYGSQWLSTPGDNLTLSLILYPQWLNPGASFRLSEAVALAVWDAVHQCLPADFPLHLKWPNDIYLQGRKTAGILIQNAFSGTQWQYAIVGIGLNVNQGVFPPELPTATSLQLAAQQRFDLEQVADTLLECLEHRYLQLKAGQTAALRREYHSRLLGMGEERQFAEPEGSVFTGRIEQVEDDGRLAIRTTEGLRVFALKEVRMLP